MPCPSGPPGCTRVGCVGVEAKFFGERRVANSSELFGTFSAERVRVGKQGDVSRETNVFLESGFVVCGGIPTRSARQGRTMKRLGVLGACVAAVVGVGCAGRGYVVSTVPVYSYGAVVVEPWEDPEFFRMRVAQRLDRIERHVRRDIATGRLPAEAINEFHARRAQIDAVVAQFSADGVIEPWERAHVRDLVRATAAIGWRHGPGHPGVEGGGPGYVPPGMYDDYDPTWDWGL